MKTLKCEAEATEASIRMEIRSEADRMHAREALDLLRLPSTMVLTPPRSSDELTSRLHCAIRCISRQLLWAGEKLTEEDWKRLMVAAVFGQRVLPSPDGRGFVVLDRKTSRMSGAMKYDLTEFVYSFGAERGVIFDEEENDGA